MNILHHIKQLAVNVGLEQDKVIGSLWFPVPYWFLPKPAADLSVLDQMRIGNLPCCVCRYVNQLQNEYVQMCTDESGDPVSRNTGCGMFVVNLQIQKSIHISDNLSVFKSELFAVLCAKWWLEHIKPPKSVICSDSEAALLALRDEMSAALYQIENVVCHVEFLGIPGHSGFEGNGMSDKLAKESLCKQTAEKFALQW